MENPNTTDMASPEKNIPEIVEDKIQEIDRKLRKALKKLHLLQNGYKPTLHPTKEAAIDQEVLDFLNAANPPGVTLATKHYGYPPKTIESLTHQEAERYKDIDKIILNFLNEESQGRILDAEQVEEDYFERKKENTQPIKKLKKP